MEVTFGTASLIFITSLSNDRLVFILGLIPASLTIVFATLTVVTGQDLFRYLMLISAFGFSCVAIKYSMREVFLSGSVDLNKIIGSVCVYLLLVFVWAIAYDLLELATPGSFHGLAASRDLSRFDEFTYFSLVTMTTLGYGDITPVSSFARIVSAVQAGIGSLYLAVVIARLVGRLRETEPES